MTDTPDTYLLDAIADLPAITRHSLKVAATEMRDAAGGRGAHQLATVYSALACAAADAEDHERQTMRDLADQLSAVRPLTAEELAEVHFDDEPQDPPC